MDMLLQDCLVNGSEPKAGEATAFSSALQRAIDYALKIQAPEGYWLGALDSNSTMEAEYLMMLVFLNVRDEAVWSKLRQHILNQQNKAGSWSLYYQGPGDLSTTVECYFALLLSGMPKSDPRLQSAKAFILANGGLAEVRVFTRIWLALFGQWSWHAIPLLIPEMIFLPTWFPFNIYALASWARATIVPLMLVMIQRPICTVPDNCSLDDLLISTPDKSTTGKTTRQLGWRFLFFVLDKSVRLYNWLPWKPGRKRAIKQTEQWILDHQEADGSWAGIQPPWVYSLIALHGLGYPLDHSVMKKGLEGFRTFSIETETTLQVQACVSPVWDTGLMVNSLVAAGVPSQHAQLQKACDWLLQKQIRVPGDWQKTCPEVLPGGWAFEFENNAYPDIDDTAEVIMALSSLLETQPSSRHLHEAIQQGLQWLLGMQSQNGGWAAFDKNNHYYFLANFPFFDFGEVLDPPSVDVTAHVLEMLGGMGYTRSNLVVKIALDFIYQEQEADGSWFGRWGVNYVYGIGGVLPALRAVGEDMTHERVQRACRWLCEHQNADGGWGESCASYVEAAQAGKGSSTPTQTAWALLGLLAAGYQDHPAVKNGVRYLCQTQTPEGTWHEPYFTGCGFPGYGTGRLMHSRLSGKALHEREPAAGFMINYHLYRHCWPIMALGRYQRVSTQGG